MIYEIRYDRHEATAYAIEATGQHNANAYPDYDRVYNGLSLRECDALNAARRELGSLAVAYRLGMQ